jgi:hypothetical protein
MAVVQNLVGLAVGPVLAGWLSAVFGLTAALTMMPLPSLASAVASW